MRWGGMHWRVVKPQRLVQPPATADWRVRGWTGVRCLHPFACWRRAHDERITRETAWGKLSPTQPREGSPIPILDIDANTGDDQSKRQSTRARRPVPTNIHLEGKPTRHARFSPLHNISASLNAPPPTHTQHEERVCASCTRITCQSIRRRTKR